MNIEVDFPIDERSEIPVKRAKNEVRMQKLSNKGHSLTTRHREHKMISLYNPSASFDR